MIIDSHAHLVAPPSLYAYRSLLTVSAGQHGSGLADVKDAELAASADNNVQIMESVGTDLQVLSPRPFMMIHRGRASDAKLWARSNNVLIKKTIDRHPTRFRGVAGLPQLAGAPIETVFDEIDYAVDELGFIGVLLNPDPGEGVEQTPPLGDPFWYPLYEKLCAMDLPAHVHSCGSCGRETYDEHFVTEESLAITSLLRWDVPRRYPELKIMISHGGGSIPYQIGRWRSNRQMQLAKGKGINDSGFGYRGKSGSGTALTPMPETPDEPFDTSLRRLWFDTCLHNPKSLELLFDVVGAERCLFGTEKPGSGGGIDAATGRAYDDLKPVIESLGVLDADQHDKVFEHNARTFFGPRLGV